MDFQDDAAEFSSEDVDTIVKNAITGCLTDVMYNPKKVRRTRQRAKIPGPLVQQIYTSKSTLIVASLYGVGCGVSVGDELLLAVAIKKAAVRSKECMSTDRCRVYSVHRCMVHSSRGGHTREEG